MKVSFSHLLLSDLKISKLLGYSVYFEVYLVSRIRERLVQLLIKPFLDTPSDKV